MLTRHAVEDFLVRYFEARRDGGAGGAWFDMHAPGATMLVDNQSNESVPALRAHFAASHLAVAEGQVTARDAGGRAFPLDGAMELVHWQPDEAEGTRGIAWMRHDDPQRDASLWVAFGLVAENDACRVAWATLNDAMSDWSWNKGRSLSLGEFPYLRTHGGQMPLRDFLDVGYRRRFPVELPPFVYRDGARFSCQGSGDCCTRSWEVTVEPEAQEFLDSLPFEEFAPHLKGTRLETKGFGKLLLKHRDAPCRFLDEQRRCLIHSYLGTPVFSTCLSYPYRFMETPDGIAVSTSFQCSSARGNCGTAFADQEPELRARMSAAGMGTVPEAFKLTDEVAVPWEVFKQVETTLRETLARTDLPLMKRLWMNARYLEAFTEGRDDAPASFEGETLEPLNEAERMLSTTFMSFLLGALSNLNALKHLSDFKWEGQTLRDEETVTRWLDAVHFGKETSYAFDLVSAHNLTVLLVFVTLALEAEAGGPLSHETWGYLGAYSSHALLVNMLEVMFEKAPFMRTEFASPYLGQMLLRSSHEAPAVLGH